MEDQEQPQAVMGATHTLRTRVDGSLSITIDVEPRHAQAAFTMFGAPGTPVAIARITPEAAVQADQQAQQKTNKPKGPWGHVYRDLYRLGWFFNPRVGLAFGCAAEDSPEEIVSRIKSSLYAAFDVESLSDLEPLNFVFHCDERGIKETVPPSIIAAAQGQAV